MSQSTQPLFGRLIPAMVTPFDDELHVDIAQTRVLARHLVDGGCESSEQQGRALLFAPIQRLTFLGHLLLTSR